MIPTLIVAGMPLAFVPGRRVHWGVAVALALVACVGWGLVVDGFWGGFAIAAPNLLVGAGLGAGLRALSRPIRHWRV